uniref:Uncharacterized protein n=1 Tax=Arundo donax TaxID=35708 RepID=A0A0A9A774_ARUDO
MDPDSNLPNKKITNSFTSKGT